MTLEKLWHLEIMLICCLVCSMALIFGFNAFMRYAKKKSAPPKKPFGQPRWSLDALRIIMTVEHYLSSYLLAGISNQSGLKMLTDQFPPKKLQRVSEGFGVYFLDRNVYEEKRSIQEFANDASLERELISVAEKLNELLTGKVVEELDHVAVTKLLPEVNHFKVSMSYRQLNLLPQ